MSNKFQQEVSPSGIAMSPAFTLKRLNGMIDKYGEGFVQSDVRFKNAREMWVTAVFLLGLGKTIGKEYRALPEHLEQTPDTYGLSVIPHAEKGQFNLLEKVNIEVTEWEEHAHGGLPETILRKLEGKHYPDYFALLVIARKPGELVDLSEVHETLSREAGKISTGYIWIPGRPETSPQGGHHILDRVFKGRARVEFDMTEEARSTAHQKEMVKFSRGVGNEFHIEAACYLPLPRLE
jgi:hypothetical protein